MAKPLTFYSLDVLGNPLLKDMVETWGHGLDEMSEVDTVWLMARISHAAFIEEPSDEPQSDEAEEVFNRLHELSYHEKLRLLQALAA